MAAVVHSFPPQSGTVTMLQTRTPSGSGSGSGMIPPSAHQNQQYGAPQQHRNYQTSVATAAPMSYRGSAAPIQPYAFTSTPSLTAPGQRQSHPNSRSSSSSAVPTTHTFIDQNGYPRSRHVANGSLPNLPMNMVPGASRDDFSLPSPMTRRGSTTPRPQSAYFASSTVQTSFASASPAKSQPDRYRRPSHRGTDPSGQQLASAGSSMPPSPAKEQRPSPSNLKRPNSFYAAVPRSMDDMQLGRKQDEPKRFRRRSMPALDAVDVPKSLAALDLQRPEQSPVHEFASKAAAGKDMTKTARLVTIKPSAPAKNGSSESLASSRSSNSRPSSVSGPICAHSRTHCPITGVMQPNASNLTHADECCSQSANRNNVHFPTGNPAQLANSPASEGPDAPRLINIPPRTSSSDAAKRVSTPSPLSKPVTMDAAGQKNGSSTAATKPVQADKKADTAAPNKPLESPAAKQLAAINQKGGKLKSKTSRLRRALSFSSAAELRKAGVGAAANDNGGPPATPKGENDSNEEELSPEQARIAEQQEAAGLGHNIYAGNSRMFAASTDNISISSTASSASIMIRKMGRGMKKGGRSLAGLFRPKSVVGVPPPDTAEGSQATVSMVTVEAERERVHVNAEPNCADGSTDYPRLERNSIDATNGLAHDRSGSSGTDNSNPRKSIVGGDRERAEVLAAVRKGILKRKCRERSF